ncbi:MAG TPA: PAS domain S-box protein [Desulfomonilaceae bacterium]|nr:PAS domain S-box protein [Desulfomonilaceae bacterium]
MTPAKLLGLLLVVFYIVALEVLAVLDIRSVFEHRVLLPILNTLFAGFVPIAVAYVAGKAYVKGGSATFLFMGCGMLSFGLCAIWAGWLIQFSDGANLNVTVYNTGAFCGSLFHAVGAMLGLIGTGYSGNIRRRTLRVVAAYVGVTVFVTCFSLAAVRGLVPPFFIQGVGPTELRQAILGSSVLLYCVSSLFLMLHYIRRNSDFTYWYSLCLAMTAMGLFAFFIQKSVGCPIGWLGRSANYVGAIFALGAILGAWRDARVKGVSLETFVGDGFAGGEASYWRGLLPVLPIPMFLILFVILVSLDLRTVFDPPGGLAALNAVFLWMLPLMVVYFATKGYLQGGLLTLLMLGSGTLTFGLGSLSSGWVMALEGGGPNATVTVLNLSALASATFHLLGGLFVLIGVQPKQRVAYKKLIVILSYLCITVVLALLTIVVLKNLTPVFFVQGQGATPLRQAIMGTAVALFIVAGLLFMSLYLFSRAKLLYWYTLALFLIATGLICYLFANSIGSPITWLGRIALYLSGIYLFMAVTSAARELRVRGESLERGIANFFRHHLESLIEERTLQLSRAKEELQAAHSELERANAELELRVEERTAELRSANEKLFLEIEHRKRAEEERLSAAKEFEDLYNNAPCGYHSLDSKGVFVRINDMELSWLGYTREEIIGTKRFQDLITLESLKRFEENYPRFMERGSVKDQEFDVLRKDGIILPVLLSATAVTDSSGKFVMSRSTMFDITERKRVEESLRESENRYRQMFQNNQAVKLLIDPESSDILDANQAASEFYGYELDRMNQMKITDINVLPPEKVIQEMSEAYAEQKNYFQFQHRLASGEMRYVEVYSSPIDLHGKRLLYSIIHDITDRHRAQEDLIRSNQDLEKFAYVASHDLQEPLRNVASCLQLLEKKYKNNLDADADKYIHYAVESAVRMKALILDLLVYSRVATTGKPPRRIDCEKVLDRTVENLRSSISEAGAVITHDPLPAIFGDDTQLLQVFQNLVANAIKFRGDAPPQIHVSGVKNKNEWIFSVKDNGIGIESQHLDRIFVIFQRLHKKSQYDGTGMGLAIVKKIVERHGGRVWAESEPRAGTIFYFTIPAIPDRGIQANGLSKK